jgi:hypothetical protein
MTYKHSLQFVADSIKQQIEDAMYADQGTKYRESLAKWLPLMSDAYRASDLKPVRSHLGASLIGDPCDRKLWYSYHWIKPEKFSGRMLRLFNTGHLSEAVFIAMLECIGVEIRQFDPETGKQFNFSHTNGHFGGSSDGIALNLPNLYEPCLLEFKTNSSKTFKKLVKEGVAKSKPVHYTQMQIGMDKLKLNFSLYMAINKDDSDIYVEIIERENYVAGIHLDRAEEIIYATLPPQRMHESAEKFECKYCDFVFLCHMSDVDNVDVNCRSCEYSFPSKEVQGAWNCERFNCDIPKENALIGCEKWSMRQLS